MSVPVSVPFPKLRPGILNLQAPGAVLLLILLAMVLWMRHSHTVAPSVEQARMDRLLDRSEPILMAMAGGGAGIEMEVNPIHLDHPKSTTVWHVQCMDDLDRDIGALVWDSPSGELHVAACGVFSQPGSIQPITTPGQVLSQARRWIGILGTALPPGTWQPAGSPEQRSKLWRCKFIIPGHSLILFFGVANGRLTYAMVR